MRQAQSKVQQAVQGLRDNPGLIDGVVPVGLTGLEVTVNAANPSASEARVVQNEKNAEGLLVRDPVQCLPLSERH
jgi:hypothetical protein